MVTYLYTPNLRHSGAQTILVVHFAGVDFYIHLDPPSKKPIGTSGSDTILIII